MSSSEMLNCKWSDRGRLPQGKANFKPSQMSRLGAEWIVRKKYK